MEAASLMPPAAAQCIEWGVSARPISGETELGDAYVIMPHGDKMLVAVIDGLGHGSEAAEASRVAVMALQRNADAPVINLVQESHKELHKTRGVVMSLASFDAAHNTMTWTGVGNVVGALFRADKSAVPARESLLLRSGVVGYQLPPLRATAFPVFPGDTLILATDGIRGDFYEESPLGRDPQEITDTILSKYGKETDDALVLVVRYLGLPA